MSEKDFTARVSLIRVQKGQFTATKDLVVKEKPVTLFLNGNEFTTLICSPLNIKELAIGFFCSEGILQKREDLKNIDINEAQGLVWVETKSCIPAANTFSKHYLNVCCCRGYDSFCVVDSEIYIKPSQVLALSQKLEEHSKLFHATGGAHSAALCTADKVVFVFEDISRHNTIDKTLGRCFLEGISTTNKLLVISGRISSEILVKVSRMNIPILISRGAPTDLALKMARELGITMIGFARGERMNIYTHKERILKTS